MKRATLILFLLMLVGCKAKPAPKLFVTAPGVPNPVNVVDGTGAGSNVLFTSGNPGVVTGGGGTITIDGGSVTANQGTAAAASGAWPVSIVNDAGNSVPVSAASLPLPTGAAQDTTLTGGSARVQVINDGGNPVPVDTPPGELKNTVALLTSPGTQLSVKGSAGTFVLSNFCNVGSSPGYWSCFDQASPDAGGTIDAGAAPFRMTPYVPAGACGNLPGSMAFTNGLQCYVSSQAGVLVQDAGVPNFIAEVHNR